MTDLTRIEPKLTEVARYLGLNWDHTETHAILAVCQRYDFDPLLKHVILIPAKGSGRASVYITRDGLLHVAHRSGVLDGIVLEDQGTDKDLGEHWAVISVYRKDMRFPFKYRGRYPVNGQNRQYGPEMAIKCAEAMALRRAFDVTGLPILDEQHPEEPRSSVVDTSHLIGAMAAPAPIQVQATPDRAPHPDVPDLEVDQDGVVWDTPEATE